MNIERNFNGDFYMIFIVIVWLMGDAEYEKDYTIARSKK